MTGLQPDLFDRINARHTDPASSAMADAEQKASGRRTRNLDRVLALLAAHPDSTSRELAVLGGIERHEAGRRLSDWSAAFVPDRRRSRGRRLSWRAQRDAAAV